MSKINNIDELLERLETADAEFPNLSLTSHLTQIAITTDTSLDDLIDMLVKRAKETQR